MDFKLVWDHFGELTDDLLDYMINVQQGVDHNQQNITLIEERIDALEEGHQHLKVKTKTPSVVKPATPQQSKKVTP